MASQLPVNFHMQYNPLFNHNQRMADWKLPIYLCIHARFCRLKLTSDYKVKWIERSIIWLSTDCIHSVFSSPGLKAQVSFSDHLSVCPSVCKLFTFSSSCPEPLGHFQPNLAQSIRFNFFLYAGPTRPFSNGRWLQNRKNALTKSSSPKLLVKFYPNLTQSLLGLRGFIFL